MNSRHLKQSSQPRLPVGTFRRLSNTPAPGGRSGPVRICSWTLGVGVFKAPQVASGLRSTVQTGGGAANLVLKGQRGNVFGWLGRKVSRNYSPLLE